MYANSNDSGKAAHFLPVLHDSHKEISTSVWMSFNISSYFFDIIFLFSAKHFNVDIVGKSWNDNVLAANLYI